MSHQALSLLLFTLALVTTAHGVNHEPLFRLDGDTISSDLDFDFELDLGGADTHPAVGDVHHHHRSVQVEVDALRGGDFAAAEPSHSLDNIAPQTFNFGRGVGYVATKRVRAHEPLFAVSMTQVMSLETAQRGRIRVLLDANPDLPPAIALALHLLEEHWLGARSNFSELLASLPAPHTATSALNSTMFYARDELEMLEGSQLLRVVTARANALDHYFNALLGPVTSRAVDPPLFSREAFTLAYFRWALGVVWSHAFPLGSSERDIALAPVLGTIAVCVDSAQCAPSRIELDSVAQQLVVFAAQDYAPGDEVALFVGDKSSTMLMVNYGVTRPTPSPTLDQVDISIVLEADDPLADVKAFLLRAQNMSMNDTYALSFAQPSLPEHMVTSLKIKLLSGAEVARVQHLFGTVASPTSAQSYHEPRHIVGLRNEFVFTRALVMTCTNLLAQYRSTLEEDEARLQELPRDGASREAQIRRMLVLEKQILHRTIALAKQQWADLVLSDHPNLLLRADGS